jgi:hypothetical protein
MGYDVKQLYSNQGHKMSDVLNSQTMMGLGEALGTKFNDRKERKVWQSLGLGEVLGQPSEAGQAPKPGGLGMAQALGQAPKAEEFSDEDYWKLMKLASDRMMENGLNARAEKTRAEALRQREIAEKEKLEREKIEYDKNVREDNEILSSYRNSMMTGRTFLNSLRQLDAQYLATEEGQDDVESTKKLAAKFFEQGQKLRTRGMARGMHEDLFVDEDTPASIYDEKIRLTKGQMGRLAKEFKNHWEAEGNGNKKATSSEVHIWMEDNYPDLNLGDVIKSKIANYSKENFETAQDNEAYEETGKQRAFNAETRGFQRAERKKEGIRTQVATDAATRGEADVLADRDTLRQFVFDQQAQEYSDNNAIALARLDPEYKKDLEELSGKSLSAMIASGIGNLFNDKKTKLVTDYGTALKKAKNKLGRPNGKTVETSKGPVTFREVK